MFLEYTNKFEEGIHKPCAGKRGTGRPNGVEHDETSNSGLGGLHTG
jgi:hypothetical protein